MNFDDAGKAIIFSTATPFGSIETMGVDLAAALVRAGVACDIIDIDAANADGTFVDRLRSWRARPPRFAAIWNGKADIVVDGRNFFDAFQIPLYSYMIDHPACHFDVLADGPDKGIISVIDRRHLDYLKSTSLPRAADVFLPHGGPPPDPAPKPMAERRTDVLFCGNLVAPFDISTAAEAACAPEMKGAPPGLAERLLDRCFHEMADPYVIVRDELTALGLNPHADDRAAALRNLVNDLNDQITISWRVRLLNALKGVRVTVLGDIAPDALLGQGSHIQAVGPVEFREFLGVLRDTKVLLNITPKFRDGGHERIFYGQARGTVPLTDDNLYLRETFEDGQSILFLPAEPEAAAQVLQDALSDLKRLDDIAGAGADVLTTHHTWDDRARRMLAHVDSL
jgi:spore maturation protein CgeB